ncbi:MAG: cytochrome ubiquinol oxidase subunit I [Anaerolineaceae bacterium]
MDTVTLSQWQFGITTVYHFFFVPLTLGLSVLVAIMETLYVATGNDAYKKMTKFWGKLFLINFAMGVVTGIVQEFQFGMNWSDYSRFVGDIFGAPLAIEALLAFFLESTFLGIWIFSWDKISKKLHLVAIWLVAIGTNLSALWILTANSFMQHPVGFEIVGERAVMSNFLDLLKNPYLWGQFPHTIFAGFTTAAFFMLGISAYHIYRKKEQDAFLQSFKIAAIVGIISVLGVVLVGDRQTKNLEIFQPMKLAAAEALTESEDPAGLSLISIVDEKETEVKEIFSFRIPKLLSFLTYNRFTGKVLGINEIQKEYEAKYGSGDYSPNVFVSYWAFRIMVGLGFLMLFISALVLLYLFIFKKPLPKKILYFFPVVIVMPYLSNTAGWILTEMGRQPWVVFGHLKTADAVSPSITPGMVLTSLITFAVIYGVLMIADIYLLQKFARAGIPQETDEVKDEGY